jgi:hypothetical protein
VRSQLRARCDAECERAILPFEVDGLADLCSRNPRIPSVYAKCELVGHRAATQSTPLRIDARPRPKCSSVGATVAFIADKSEGGTITCT